MRISGKSQKDTEEFAALLKDLMFRTKYDETLLRIKGPAEAPMAWLKSYYRIHFLMHAQKAVYLSSFLSSFLPKVYQLIPAGIRFSVDVDPTSML